MANQIRIGGIRIDLALGFGQFDRDAKKAQNQLRRLERSFKKAGDRALKAFTLPVAGIGTIAAKAAIDFESAFAGVRKTVDATESQFSRIRKDIARIKTVLNEKARVSE